MMPNKEITVDELYKEAGDTIFYRITNYGENHNGFQYKTGVNVDTIPFNPTGKCTRSGLYFFSKYQLVHWDSYCLGAYHIREVSFDGLEDARIYRENEIYKCDKFRLADRKVFTKYIPDYFDFSNRDVYERILKHDKKAHMYIANQTRQYCLDKVREKFSNIKYIKKQTHEICMININNSKINPKMVINTIRKITPELFMAMVKRNGFYVRYFNTDNCPEICIEAVKRTPLAIQYIKNPKTRIAALKQHRRPIHIYKSTFNIHKKCISSR
jgi:hypothetical protein